MSSATRTEWITLASGQAAWLALPPAGHGPGLLLWQEIFGVNTHIRQVAEQYALDGFVVLAPDVFWRQEPRLDIGYQPADIERGRALAMALQPADVAADLRTAATALRARSEVGARKVGTVGYCMGGRLAFLSAAMAGVDAAVAYYGGGIQGQLDQAARISAPMLFHYAEHDDNIPLEAVDHVREAMQRRGASAGAATFHVYPGARHGFNCWDRASYDARSAAVAHGRTLAFLAEHLY